MILVIEGIEGCGKTTVARAISERTGWPVHKPLQLTKAVPGRWSSEELARWRRVGVPIQTHAEDMYVIDALALQVSAGQRPGFIMDRSMFSGLAYDQDLCGFGEEEMAWVFARWARLAKLAGTHVLHFDQEPHVSLSRMDPLDPRRSQGKLGQLRVRIQQWMSGWQNASGIYTYVNADQPPEAVLSDVLRALDLK